jgi:hypothetical protein
MTEHNGRRKISSRHKLIITRRLPRRPKSPTGRVIPLRQVTKYVCPTNRNSLPGMPLDRIVHCSASRVLPGGIVGNTLHRPFT